MDNSDQNKMIKYCLIALGVIAVLILIVFIQMLIGPSKETEEVSVQSELITENNTNTQASEPQRIIERVENDEVTVEENTNTTIVQNPLDVLNGKKDGIVAVYENAVIYESSDNSAKVVMEFNPENQNMTEMYMELYWPTEEYAITYVEQLVGTDMENQVSREGTVVKIDFMGEDEELEFKKDDVIKSVEDSYNVEYR